MMADTSHSVHGYLSLIAMRAWLFDTGAEQWRGLGFGQPDFFELSFVKS
jgi:hypothetical protein